MSRTTVITGANRGIGLQMTRLSLGRTDRVIATARQPEEAEALAAMRDGPGTLEIVELDVTDEGAHDRLAEAVGESLDLLICNAGQYRGRGRMDDDAFAADDWQAVLMTNVAGPFFAVRALRPALARAKGKVAVVSSIMASSERAPGGSYIYRASKAAATNLARNLAQDLKGDRIAVGAYHPGWVQTDMGGGSADITAEESAGGLLERFEALSMATTGVFEDHRGQAIAF